MQILIRLFSILFTAIFFLFNARTSLAQQYTLTDDDIEMTPYGYIESCSYDFSIKDIIIPDVIDGQTVTGILDKQIGQTLIFGGKGITSIELPSTIKYIGDNAFYNNAISTLDLTKYPNLKTVRDRSFANNNITVLKLENHPNLSLIGNNAFTRNSISSVSFKDCTTLKRIGFNAFNDNDIETLNFENCVNLNSIGFRAFYKNKLSTLDFSDCHALVIIREGAFKENPSLTSFMLPEITHENFKRWIDVNGNTVDGNIAITDFDMMYGALVSHTINEDDDLDIRNNTLYGAKYDGIYTDIIFPEELNGEKIKRTISSYPGIRANTSWFGSMGNQNILSLKIPSTFQVIGANAFRNNPLIFFDLTEATSLSEIQTDAFLNNKLIDIDLSNCLNLTVLEDDCFYSFNGVKTFELPNTVTTADFIFNHWYENKNKEIPFEGLAETRNEYRANIINQPDITFIVTDGVNPLADALVTMPPWELDLTDEEGRTVANNTTNNSTWNYKVSKKGYSTVEEEITTSTSVRTENIVLEPLGKKLVITVTDEQNSPLKNAKVLLVDYGTTFTNELGQVTYPSVLPETLSYSIDLDEFESLQGNFDMGEADQDKTLIVKKVKDEEIKDDDVDNSDEITNISFTKHQTLAYPNPANGLITLPNAIDQKVVIYDALGIKKLSALPNKADFVLDVSNLSNGVYMLKINTNYQRIVIEK
ncbi:leucine-rich repeat domain-containing protein [Reichenbachiella versicolor]|uniref:leucine-rich repeat domain-containing protein n=1 Tax=Reichenbachiella versicolor TaxID=1821036 RepID=UPI000D6E34EB|nr:leucine-rich repeat protein [Reichenbachiella versicolor]